MDHYIQIHFIDLSGDDQEILIALLSDMAYDGFEQGKDFLKAFIRESLYDQEQLKSLPGYHRFTVKIEKIIQINWNEEWEKSFDPVVVDNFCAIRAAFHSSVPGVKHEIIITPKMSFGTGHHATTFLVIQMMQYEDFVGKRVLDFGTGTGVLGILAERLGADTVIAIDNDDWSIDNAGENIAANNCSRILLKKTDHIAFIDAFDIIIANINRHVILENLSSLAKHLRPNGVLILSGLLKDDDQIVTESALNQHLFVKKRSQKYDWIALKLSNVNSM